MTVITGFINIFTEASNNFIIMNTECMDSFIKHSVPHS